MLAVFESAESVSILLKCEASALSDPRCVNNVDLWLALAKLESYDNAKKVSPLFGAGYSFSFQWTPDPPPGFGGLEI